MCNTCCHFLELPAELRNRIYELLLEDHEPVKLRYRDRRSLHPNILATCRCINNEAMSILYGANTIMFPMSSALDIFKPFTQHARHLRKVALMQDHRDCKTDLARWLRFLLRTLPSLTRLELMIVEKAIMLPKLVAEIIHTSTGEQESDLAQIMSITFLGYKAMNQAERKELTLSSAFARSKEFRLDMAKPREEQREAYWASVKTELVQMLNAKRDEENDKKSSKNRKAKGKKKRGRK